MSNDPSRCGTAINWMPGTVSPGPGVVGLGVAELPDGRELFSPGLGATGGAPTPVQAAVALYPSTSATAARIRTPVRPVSSTPDVRSGRNP
jgi:hypothetical protein